MNDAEKTTVRSAWTEFGTGSAKNMDNEGGRPFQFPGKVPGFENMFPDVDRINPEYFHYLDRKIDYLNDQEFVAFIEVSRRDASQCWSKYYQWPDSYARFIQYIWSRYQANNTVLSPIHLDIISESIGPDDFSRAIKLITDKFGPPPFGTLLSANANPSTLENWGDDSWVTLHQIGNVREHYTYWYLTEIFRQPNPKPALNGEPYYSGYTDARSLGRGRGYQYGAPGGTEKDDQYVRSAMYGSFLSGGLAGHVYGTPSNGAPPHKCAISAHLLSPSASDTRTWFPMPTWSIPTRLMRYVLMRSGPIARARPTGRFSWPISRRAAPTVRFAGRSSIAAIAPSGLTHAPAPGWTPERARFAPASSERSPCPLFPPISIGVCVSPTSATQNPCYTELVEHVRQNLTLVIEEELLLAARKIALDKRTSVNQLVREYLASLVEEHSRKRVARARLKQAFETGLVEVGDLAWSRDDLYER
jgi:hypothetical protein